MSVAGQPKLRRFGDLAIAFSGYVEAAGQAAADPHQCVAATYRTDGPMLSRILLGQYCTVVVDRAGRSVVLAQDSLGLRKLFYCFEGDVLIVASDLDLLLSERGHYEIDESYFIFYIGTGAGDRTRTPFRDVHRLTYGSTIEITRAGVKRHRPWNPAERAVPETGKDAEARLRELLEQAVSASLPRSGAILCELTGGLDSSSIYTTAQRIGRPLEAITYVSQRGMAGDDELFAAQVAARSSWPWHRLDIDTDELIPEDHGGFVPEPQAILYAHQFDLIEKCIQRIGANVLLTGAVGDVIFEFGGITPAFLADPLAAGSLPRAIKLARRWAAARATTRSWSHFLRHVAWPIARRHRRGLSVLDWGPVSVPSWLSAEMRRGHGLDVDERPQRAPRVAEPGRQHLWESVYDLAAHENGPFYRRLSADVRHPLYHRPLVDFMLGLDFSVRRGFEGDRRLQRRALADRLPEAVLTRRSKGSAQELRERHLMESRRWYRAMTVEPRIVQRGWVDAKGWREQVDRARVGASDLSARFINAVQTELWLQALERTPMPPRLSPDLPTPP